jgi:hypothetical protein
MTHFTLQLLNKLIATYEIENSPIPCQITTGIVALSAIVPPRIMKNAQHTSSKKRNILNKKLHQNSLSVQHSNTGSLSKLF